MQFPADLVTFTEEILNGKLHFFRSVRVIFVADAGVVSFQNGRVLKCAQVVLLWTRFLFYSKTYLHFCGNYSMIRPYATKTAVCFTVFDTVFPFSIDQYVIYLRL